MQATRSADALTDQLVAFAVFVMKSGSADAFAVAGAFDLSLSQLKAVFIIGNAPAPLAVHELSAHIGLSVAATGRAVDGLVRGGLVTRTEDLADRRVKRLALTEAGSEAIGRIAASRRAGVARVVATLTPTERSELSQVLDPILARIAQQNCAPFVSEPQDPTP